jgi:hypothetical protein
MFIWAKASPGRGAVEALARWFECNLSPASLTRPSAQGLRRGKWDAQQFLANLPSRVMTRCSAHVWEVIFFVLDAPRQPESHKAKLPATPDDWLGVTQCLAKTIAMCEANHSQIRTNILVQFLIGNKRDVLAD